MIILADVGNVAGDAHDRLARWIDDGGVLVRFAGPRLAASDDDLVPVKLRRGGRMLGGSLSWDQPQQLAAFSRESPFNGMPVPNDVTVTRQVLAEPDAGLSDHTWATLGDGTPLVTAARRGKGMIVLFHVTADTRWSDLPLSGAFVDMLKRIVGLSGAVAATEANAADRRRERPRRDAADPRARRLRRLRAAAADRAADPGDLLRPRHRRQSARLLRPAGRPRRRQYAGAGGPADADRLRPAQCARRILPHQRAAGSARPDLPRRARAAADRRAGGVLARRRPLPADAAAGHAPPRCAGRGLHRLGRSRARRRAGLRPDRSGGRPVRRQGHHRDPPRLCRDRRLPRRTPSASPACRA